MSIEVNGPLRVRKNCADYSIAARKKEGQNGQQKTRTIREDPSSFLSCASSSELVSAQFTQYTGKQADCQDSRIRSYTHSLPYWKGLG